MLSTQTAIQKPHMWTRRSYLIKKTYCRSNELQYISSFVKLFLFTFQGVSYSISASSVIWSCKSHKRFSLLKQVKWWFVFVKRMYCECVKIIYKTFKISFESVPWTFVYVTSCLKLRDSFICLLLLLVCSDVVLGWEPFNRYFLFRCHISCEVDSPLYIFANWLLLIERLLTPSCKSAARV